MSTIGWGEKRFWENYDEYKDTYWKYGAPRDVLHVDWKSRKYRDHSVPHPAKITLTMKKCLKRLLSGDKTGCGTRTIKALRWRELCDDNANLTEHGKAIAIQWLSLEAQCGLLGIPLETWRVSDQNEPETTVVKILSRENKRAYFSENSFTNVIDFFLLGELIPLSIEQNKTLYNVDVTQYPELFYIIKSNLPEVLLRIDEHTCQNNLNLFYEYFGNDGCFGNPIHELEFYKDILNSFGVITLRHLIEMFFSNPLAYSWRGWPDIVVTGEQEPYFIEVKTTDKLHLNQLVTIPDLIKWTGIVTKCVKLIPK